MSTRKSTELAADSSLFQIWDPAAPMPDAEHMQDLDVITHVTVERAQLEGYHYLHESALALYRERLHLCWANHRVAEYNIFDELLRGTVSSDGGLTWSPVKEWIAPPTGGSLSYNHPILHVHQGKLLAFVARWNPETPDQPRPAKPLTCCNEEGVGPQPATEIFMLNDATGQMQSLGTTVPGFIPFRPPIKMRDGNWIVGGERFWYEPAVIISHGDDFSKWKLIPIPRPQEIDLQFPETTLIDQGDRIIAFCRPRHQQTAPVSVSHDCGQTWSPLQMSNYPMASAKPFAGLLSTGQHYLITCHLEEGRGLITIAVTEPGGRLFKKIWKIRHQHFPRRRHFPGYLVEGKVNGSEIDGKTEWSYPAAIEHQGNLYVSYTQGKEDCILSIIPIRALAVS